MRIAITGHSKGLGEALFEFLSQKHKIIGFCRSNGYDIKSPSDRKKIIKESKDCDIFINLVHNYYHQTDLLFELHKSWKGLQKYIINIGTSVVDDENFGLSDYQMSEYKVQKTTLVDMITTLKKGFQYPILKLYVISEINFDKDISNLNSIIENDC
jgi:5,10-methylene-tetrahydrofolate dehydrogenase/methenyl tetrahydrofolate cyclohydrolase